MNPDHPPEPAGLVPIGKDPSPEPPLESLEWEDPSQYLVRRGLALAELLEQPQEDSQPDLSPSVAAFVPWQCFHTWSEHTKQVQAIALSGNRQWLASGSYDRTVQLWQVQTGRHHLTLTAHTDYVTTVAFSPDSQLLVTGSWDRTLKLWRPESGELLDTLPVYSNRVIAVAVSPQGQILACGLVGGQY
ncbi:WD40 repeat domain-containing protein [Neosynechococcus sphagnicola]|nr:hypothetical protein [Neosynechococcus sphagnicola]